MPLLRYLLALSAIGLLTSCALPARVTAPAIPKIPPASCLLDCPVPPPRQNPRPEWERQMEDWAFTCHSRHQTCADWARKQIEQTKPQ